MRRKDIAIIAFCLLMVAVGFGAIAGGVYQMFRVDDPRPAPSVSPWPGSNR